MFCCRYCPCCYYVWLLLLVVFVLVVIMLLSFLGTNSCRCCYGRSYYFLPAQPMLLL